MAKSDEFAVDLFKSDRLLVLFKTKPARTLLWFAPVKFEEET